MKEWNLPKHDKSHPFKAPDGYFDQLYADILDRKTGKAPKRAWNWRPVIQLAPAAMLIGLTVGVYFLHPFHPTTAEEILAEVAHEDIEAYLFTYELNSMDYSELIEESGELEWTPGESWLDDMDDSANELYLEFGIDETDLMEI